MAQYTNTTRTPLAFPKKGGGIVDIRPGETVTAEINEESAQFKGYITAGALLKGKPTSAVTAEVEAPRNRAPKAD